MPDRNQNAEDGSCESHIHGAKSKMSIVVVIATIGRPAELELTVGQLNKQTCMPDRIIISAVDKGDIGTVGACDNVTILMGSAGSCAQRNRALDSIHSEFDIICFFDDDYLPSCYTIEGLLCLFSENPEIAGATGHLLADGVNSVGLSVEKAKQLLEEFDSAPRDKSYSLRISSIGLYGCNMAFRRSAILDERFDERLPLYGWQEDIDFATRVSKRGQLISTTAFSGVHLGVKGGRTSGLRIGYSQIANPIYLVRKGTMPLPFAVKLILRNVLANLVKAPFPEPWLDRGGRMRGNFHAIFDLITGRLSPSRILEMK